MTNPLQQLKTQGQSVWYDNIDRAQLVSGEFKRLLDQDGISGITSNPTIFDKDISSGHTYDDQMTQLIKDGKSTSDIYDALGQLGIHYAQVTQKLLDEGIQKFADSFHQLIASVEKKRQDIHKQIRH